eukprot:gene45070-55130_t
MGILAGGNWIIDNVKIVDVYPKEEKLANILRESTSNGGAPYNVLKAISKMGFQFPLKGIGAIGNDELGDHILDECRELQIDSSQIKKVEDTNTSYTDVMTVQGTGRRTFFHSRGANAFLDESYFNFSENSYLKYSNVRQVQGLPVGLGGLEQLGRDLAARAMHHAKGLMAMGIRPGDHVGVLLPSCIEFVDILFGVALAGGVTVKLPLKSGYMFEEGSILSPDGRCRAFDAKARGTIFGSGVGVVALKRLEDAV